MAIPYLDEEKSKKQSCKVKEANNPKQPDCKNVQSGRTMLIAVGIVIAFTYFSQQSNTLIKFNNRHKIMYSRIILMVNIYMSLIILIKYISKHTIRDTKVNFLFHRVKIKVNWPEKPKHEYASISFGKDSDSEWIFNNIIKQFRIKQKDMFTCFPFFPKDYRSVVKEGKSRHCLDMVFEAARFASFATFPYIQGVYATRLAEAGFYFSGSGDEVICFSCGIKHGNWKRNDSPFEIHKKIAPNCSFLNSVSNDRFTNSKSSDVVPKPNDDGACGSIYDTTEEDSSQFKPVASNEVNGDILQSVRSDFIQQNELGRSSTSLTVNSHQPFCSSENNSFQGKFVNSTNGGSRANTLPSSNLSNNDTQSLIRITQNSSKSNSSLQRNHVQELPTSNGKGNCPQFDSMSMGVCIEKPKYPTYAIRSTRLDSFNIWPKHLVQSPDEMAIAGFFFTGIEDHCRCFFCGGGLRNWEPDDQPWIEHARWYPNCAFVRQCKGDKFIEDVRMNRQVADEFIRKNEGNRNIDNVGCKQKSTVDCSTHPAVLSVSEFGYDQNLIKRAYDALMISGASDISGTVLLEKIFELEESSSKNTSSTIVPPLPEKPTATMIAGISNQSPPYISRTTENAENDNEKTASKDLELSIKSLEEENQNLKDQQTCKICLDEPVSIVFLPCGHMAACITCAPALRRCPICRAFIKGTVKAIMC